MTLNDTQISVIRCAFLDLCGALEAQEDLGGHEQHDWESHAQTIEEMVEQFPTLNLKVPDAIKHLVYP